MTKKKTECDVEIRVEKHIISKNHELYCQFDNLCFLSKNLYNYANYHIRQTFIICSKLSEDKKITKENQDYLAFINSKVDEYNIQKEINFEKAKLESIKKNKDFNKKLKVQKYFGKDNKYLGYDFLDFLVKEGTDYKALMAQVSQQILRLLDKNWVSFFESIKKWSRDKAAYTGRPKLPNYLKKDGRNIIIFTNQNCKYIDDYIQFPTCLNQYMLQTKVSGKLQQIRVLPRNKYFVLEVVYEKPKVELKQDNGKYISIDIGLDNLAAIANNFNVTPIIVSGKKLKSINKYYNKKVSHYREVAKRMNNLDYTNKMNKLTMKRNNMINDLIHKASKSVIEHALSCEANTIIIGNNKDWKRESDMSKEVNQSFVGIPHQDLINKITYKAEDAGINVIITEEFYTSGTSSLDKEMPIKENYNKNRRVYRGLFKSNKGRLINADINASIQIMKKVFSNAFDGYEIEGLGLTPIRVSL